MVKVEPSMLAYFFTALHLIQRHNTCFFSRFVETRKPYRF